MASLSELLKSKSANDQARIEERRAEREDLSKLRDDALTGITSKPKQYDTFLVLQADNIKCSAGNVALTMWQMENPSRIGSTAFWHEQGRYVRDEEMSSGARVFVPPRNPKQRGYLMGEYYDVSQTTGKPLKEIVPLAEDSERLDGAIEALLDATRAGFTENAALDVPARYNEEICAIEINPQYSKMQVFTALAT